MIDSKFERGMVKVGGNEIIVSNSMFGTSRGRQENIECGEGCDLILLGLKEPQVCTVGMPDYLQV